ncbi:MAG TPA: hypothetical protein ENK58_01325 [Desulfobacterales bacterium]|nr:MAG: hypothetical protein DRI57_25190 [Deltaproteobacteria bacterium]HHC24045.1 hypothetical protein [Desulfobacterales bacterium]
MERKSLRSENVDGAVIGAIEMVILLDGKVIYYEKIRRETEESKAVHIRHYTNTSGLEGISKSGVIMAKDKGRVFAELVRKKSLSPREAEEKYGLKPGHGRNYVETQIDEERAEEVYNRYTRSYELQIRGDVELKRSTRFVIRNRQGAIINDQIKVYK